MHSGPGRRHGLQPIHELTTIICESASNSSDGESLFKDTLNDYNINYYHVVMNHDNEAMDGDDEPMEFDDEPLFWMVGQQVFFYI